MAQDVFKEYLYSPNLIFKHREKISLTEEQAASIKKYYNASTLSYNDLKWDLDARMIKLEELLRQPSVDIAKAEAELSEIVRVENQIKKERLRTMIQIKNVLTGTQQNILNDHKTDQDTGYEIMTPVNQDPRVVLRVNGQIDSNEPLFIVKEGKTTTEVKSLAGYDPNKIESIEVLKGNSAVSKYGEKGRNGVVIVTIK
jgi:TonB-dependent SusC/RagA subfamily outer membrane receptor